MREGVLLDLGLGRHRVLPCVLNLVDSMLFAHCKLLNSDQWLFSEIVLRLSASAIFADAEVISYHFTNRVTEESLRL